MKKYLIPALALAAASVAVPAMAQNHGPQRHDDRGGRYEQDRGGRYDNDRGGRYDNDRGGNNWQNISQRKYQLDRRIDQGERNLQLSRREAGRLRAELNALVRLEYSYSRGGLSWRERQDLDARYDRLQRQVRAERRDHNNRPY
ncbi:MAG: hypothetical protein ACOH1E_05325 [Brevundimonas sp.]